MSPCTCLSPRHPRNLQIKQVFPWMNGLNLAWHCIDEHDILYGYSGNWEVLNASESPQTHHFGLSQILKTFCWILIYYVLFLIYFSFAFSLCKLCLKDLDLYFKFYFSLWHIPNRSETPRYNLNENKREKKLSWVFSILPLLSFNWSVLMSSFSHFKMCNIWSIISNHTKNILWSVVSVIFFSRMCRCKANIRERISHTRKLKKDHSNQNTWFLRKKWKIMSWKNCMYC